MVFGGATYAIKVIAVPSAKGSGASSDLELKLVVTMLDGMAVY